VTGSLQPHVELGVFHSKTNDVVGFINKVLWKMEADKADLAPASYQLFRYTSVTYVQI
jgi:hypothetical protein